MRDIVREADEILERAKKNLRTDKHLTPVAFIMHDEGTDIVGMQFADKRAKRRAYAAINQLCRQRRAYAAILVNEAWFTTEIPRPHERKRSAEEFIAEAERGVPPSLDPRRREGIVVSVIGPGIKPRVRLVPFHRVAAGEIVFEREDEWSEAGVAMIEPWWNVEPTRQ